MTRMLGAPCLLMPRGRTGASGQWGVDSLTVLPIVAAMALPDVLPVVRHPGALSNLWRFMAQARESYGSVHIGRAYARLRLIRTPRRRQGHGAGTWLLVQPLRELEAQGLV